MIQVLIRFPFLLLFAFISFYIPGSILIKRIYKSGNNLICASVLGAAMWGMQAWVFGWLKLRYLTYIYLLVTVILWLRLYLKEKQKLNLPGLWLKIKAEKRLIFLILFGLIIQLPAAFFFGLTKENGMSLVSSMPPDLEWRASLIYQLTKAIPPTEPAMYGVIVKNYHYFGDIIIAEFIRVFHTPLIITTFQFFSILLSVFLGLSAVTFSRKYKLGRVFETTILVLLYTGGDLNPFITFILGHGFHFRMGAMESGADLLTNYPRAFATIFVFISLVLLKKWHEKQNITADLLLALLTAAAVGSKVNTGLLLVFGFITLVLFYLIKKQPRRLLLLLFIGLLVALVYLPVNINAGGLVYTGFWRVQDYIVHPELGLSYLELARQIYTQHNNTLRVLQYNLIFLALYVFATFGVKTLSLIQTQKSLKQIPLYLHLVLTSGLLVCFILGMFFLQASGGANSFNFLSTVFIFLSIYTALSISFVITSIKYKPLYYFILLILFIFTSIRSFNISWSLYREYFNNKHSAIPQSELNVYRFIKDNIPKQAVFLKGNYQLSYLGNKHIYFPAGGSLDVLKSHGVNTKEREDLYKKIFSEYKPEQTLNILKKKGINYIILDYETLPIATLSSELYSYVYDDSVTKIIKLR